MNTKVSWILLLAQNCKHQFLFNFMNQCIETAFHSSPVYTRCRGSIGWWEESVNMWVLIHWETDNVCYLTWDGDLGCFFFFLLCCTLFCFFHSSPYVVCVDWLIFVLLGFKVSGSHLLGRRSTTWNTPPASSPYVVWQCHMNIIWFQARKVLLRPYWSSSVA
jgi:hypothetical protein